jgi:hypothetical protein
VGFYYGSNEPPKGGPDRGGGFRETLLITWVVFSVLAKPLGILFGGVLYLVLVFVLFGLHPAAGLAALGLPIAALVSWGFWEWRHPPELK